MELQDVAKMENKKYAAICFTLMLLPMIIAAFCSVIEPMPLSPKLHFVINVRP